MKQLNSCETDVFEHKSAWFAYRVRARQEKSVAIQLKEKREECFVPLVRTTKLWGKRIAHVELPLFSGYVFCRSQRYRMLSILTTPGIVGVVRAGTSPVPVAGQELAAIKRTLDAGAMVEPCDYVGVGRRVEIRRGPLAGTAGIVTERRRNAGLVLSVSLIRCSIFVHVDLADICKSVEPAIVSEEGASRLITPSTYDFCSSLT